MSDGHFSSSYCECNWEGGQHLDSEIVVDGGAAIDRFFDALGEAHRRFILLYLNDTGNADLNQLVESIAEREEGDPGEEQLKRIRVSLHHHHLPKLSKHGLISYDTRTDSVSLEPLPRAAREILDLAQDLEAEEEGTH